MLLKKKKKLKECDFFKLKSNVYIYRNISISVYYTVVVVI